MSAIYDLNLRFQMSLILLLLFILMINGCNGDSADSNSTQIDEMQGQHQEYLQNVPFKDSVGNRDKTKTIYGISFAVSQNGDWAAASIPTTTEDGRKVTDIQIVDLVTSDVRQIIEESSHVNLISVMNGAWLGISSDNEGGSITFRAVDTLSVVGPTLPAAYGWLNVTGYQSSILVYQPDDPEFSARDGDGLDALVVDLETSNQWRVQWSQHRLGTGFSAIVCNGNLILRGWLEDEFDGSVAQIWSEPIEGSKAIKVAELKRWDQDLMYPPPLVGSSAFGYRTSRETWNIAQASDGTILYEIRIPDADGTTEFKIGSRLRFLSDDGYSKATGKLLCSIAKDGEAQTLVTYDFATGDYKQQAQVAHSFSAPKKLSVLVNDIPLVLCLGSWIPNTNRRTVTAYRIKDLLLGESFEFPYGPTAVGGTHLVTASKEGFWIVDLEKTLSFNSD